MPQNKCAVYWEDELVGWLSDYIIDNFRLYGQWIPTQTEKSLHFFEALSIEDNQLWVKVGNIDSWCTVEFPPDPNIEFTLRIYQHPD